MGHHNINDAFRKDEEECPIPSRLFIFGKVIYYLRIKNQYATMRLELNIKST